MPSLAPAQTIQNTYNQTVYTEGYVSDGLGNSSESDMYAYLQCVQTQAAYIHTGKNSLSQLMEFK